MIDLCYAAEKDNGLRPFDRATFIAQLEDSGLAFRRVAQPRAGIPCLLFASVDSECVAKLPPDGRRQVVLVAEGDGPTAAEAEATRDSLGLLALVEPRAWRSWQRDLFVAWGLYGRMDIAKQAGLVPLDTQGLQPPEEREGLPATLARLLFAAERAMQSIGPD